MGWSRLREARGGDMMSGGRVHIWVLVCFLLFGIVSALESNFSLTSISNKTIDCLGSSSVTPEVEGLRQAACLTPFPCTNGSTYPAIAGTCSYFNPLQFSNSTKSFNTMFSFNTLKFPTFNTGDGFTFFLSASKPDASGAAGGYLGWLNNSTNNDQSLHNFAVEFDLVNETLDGVPYDNSSDSTQDDHVGVNINSLTSRITYQLKDSSYLSSLSSAEEIYAWIDYDGARQWIDVRINQENRKPCKPIISQHLDLSTLLLDVMYAGFSASTGGPERYNTQTTVFDWSFSTDGQATNIYGEDEKCELHLTLSEVLGTIIGILVLAMILMLCVIFLFYRRTRKVSALERERAELVAELKKLGPQNYPYQEISEGTHGFEEQIGKGGFGTVYMGNLSCRGSKTTVAVKKIKRTLDSVDDAKQLVAEVKVIGTLRHVNIVPLIGWCCEKGQMLLVYKYMENGDLHQQLFPKDPDFKSDRIFAWEKRMNILRGVAAALKFLHEDFESEQTVLHRDIKPSNIMIDGNFNARLGDFGLARFYDRNNEGSVDHYSRTGYSRGHSPDHSQPMGTLGYMAPEYLNNGATVETDVFSFGVVVLVVATGRRAIDKSLDIPGHNLVNWVRQLYEEERIRDAMDLELLDNDSTFKLQEMERVLRVGLFCCLVNPQDRPSMREVVNALENAREGTSPIFSRPMPQRDYSSGGSTHDFSFSDNSMEDDVTRPFEDYTKDTQQLSFNSATQSSLSYLVDIV